MAELQTDVQQEEVISMEIVRLDCLIVDSGFSSFEELILRLVRVHEMGQIL